MPSDAFAPSAPASAAASVEVVVGIDIGGTGTRFVAADPTTSQVLARATIPTPATGTADEILSFLRDQVARVTGGHRPLGVGIGASGPIDLDGVIRNPDTLPAFTGVPIREGMRAVTDGPVEIANDAVCAALAEHLVGAARNWPRSLHVTLGTGVGVCLLNGDQPFRNQDGTHPEGGHVAVATPTTPCYCGRPACWEQAASRQSLQRAAATILDRGPRDRTVIFDLAARAEGDDPVARAAFASYGERVADGLGTLLTLYGPSLVVIGGSAASHLELYRRGLESALSSLHGWIPEHQILQTALDDDGGAIGAAHLATVALQDRRS